MRDEQSALSAFLAVAEERSFTRAAKKLNISTSGLSHAIRRLEEQIGVRLLTRTTRSVSATDAGEQLLAHLRPALADIRGTLTNLSGLQTSQSLRTSQHTPGRLLPETCCSISASASGIEVRASTGGNSTETTSRWPYLSAGRSLSTI